MIPIVRRPIPGWEMMSLDALQALLTNAKPISPLSNREKAKADVVDGRRKVVEAVCNTTQPVEKLPAELMRECMGLTTCGFL